jgi:hypothetical protein
MFKSSNQARYSAGTAKKVKHWLDKFWLNQPGCVQIISEAGKMG